MSFVFFFQSRSEIRMMKSSIVIVLIVAVAGTSALSYDEIRKKAEADGGCISAGGTIQCFPSKKEEKCEEGTTMTDDCNECSCNGGSWVCSLIGCAGIRETSCEEEGQTKRVDCNTCTCTNGGWACTEIGCSSKRDEKAEIAKLVEERANCIQAGNVRQCFQKREEMPRCMNGKVYKIDCNWCECDGGEWMCTLNMCPGYRSLRTLRTSPHDFRSLIPASRSLSRETRSFSYEFRSFARRSPAPFPGVSSECEDDSVKTQECNPCLCIGGQWMCHSRMCHPIGKRETSDSALSRRGTRMDCHRGQTRMMDCNRCKCIGGRWGCTLNDC